MFGTPRNLQPHYNIAPTMTVDVIRLGKDGKRELVPMRWGLIPERWKKSAKETPATFNARAGTSPTSGSNLDGGKDGRELLTSGYSACS